MSHQNRRSPLPKDYQFGDAGRGPTPSQVAYGTSDASWLRVLADQFKQLDNGRWVLRYGTELFAWTPMRLRAIADGLTDSLAPSRTFTLSDIAHVINDVFEPGPGRFLLLRAFTDVAVKRWRPMHANAAEQLARRGEYNIIEGDHE